MSSKKEIEINLNHFKISPYKFFRNLVISIILLILFSLFLYYFFNPNYTYTASYKIRINEYNYDKFLKNYEVTNSNLFGLTFNNFEGGKNKANLLYDRIFILDEINDNLSSESINNTDVDNKYLILTKFDRNNLKPNLKLKISHNFKNSFTNDFNPSNLRLETNEIANTLFDNAYEAFDSTINDYQNQLFEIYKIKSIQETQKIKNKKTEQEIISSDSKNDFMLNLIMDFIISPNRSGETVENNLNKSDIYLKLLNQLNDIPIEDINQLDTKLDLFYNFQIEKIKNLQYQDSKLKIDFINFDLEEEIIPDLNYFNIKIIFLLLVFFFLSNLLLAVFSK